MDRNAAIAKRLVALREALGMTQAEFCRAIKTKPNRWNQYEKGTRRITIDVAIRIKRRYGITIDWIYLGDPACLPARLHPQLSDAA